MKKNRKGGEAQFPAGPFSLASEKEKLRMPLENINDNFIILDHDDNFFYINSKAQKFFTHNNLLGKNIWQEYPLFVGSNFYNQISKVRTEKAHIIFEDKIPGSDKWFRMSAYPFHYGTVIFFEETTAFRSFRSDLLKIKKKYKNQFDILNSVVSLSQDPIFIFNDKSQILFLNHAAENLLNKTPEELIGKSLGDIRSAPVNFSEIVRKIGISFSLKLPVKGEVAGPRKNGQKPTLEYILTPIFSKKPSSRLVLCIMRDLTVHKKIESDLRVAKNQLEVILENIFDGISVYDPNGNLLYANKTAVKLNGFKSEEDMKMGGNFRKILGNRLAKFIIKDEENTELSPEETPLYVSFKKNIRTEELLNYINKKKGDKYWFLSKAHPVFDDRGKLQMVVNIINDLTNQKIVEQELSAAKNQLEAILKHIANGITVFDTQGRLLYFNDASWRLFGFNSASEMEKIKTIYDLYYSQVTEENPPTTELGEELKTKDLSTIKALSGKEFNFTIYHLYNRREGRYLWIKAKSQLVRDNNGRPQMVINIIEDITEQKELEKRKYDFISIISHEFKTPLTSIKAFAQLLQKDMESKGDIKSQRYLAKMNSQIDRFLTLVLELLDISKMNEQGLALTKEDFNVGYLVREIKSDLSENICQQINIEDDGDVMVFADRQRIGQVLTNLISNAAKFSRPDQPINIRVKRGRAHAVISVQDFGIGISPEDQKKIFDRFYQVHGSLPYQDPSLGLGLYISSEIIRLHRGNLWVQSRKKQGSTFYFTIPF